MKDKTIAGYNVTCVGDDRVYSFVPSRNGKTISDKIGKHVLKWIDRNFVQYSWLDRGSDNVSIVHLELICQSLLF